MPAGVADTDDVDKDRVHVTRQSQVPSADEEDVRTRGSTMTVAVPALPSYANGISDQPLLGDTIEANLARTVSRFPNRTAVIDVAADKAYSYAELDRLTDSLALALLADGVKIGDRVGIWAPNC